MKTVKIYKATCTTAPTMDAEGSGFSLSPWGSNTDHYEGYDDGGIDYHLPPSCTLATTQSGELAIFDAKDVRLKKAYDAICSAQLILNDAIREMH